MERGRESRRRRCRWRRPRRHRRRHGERCGRGAGLPLRGRRRSDSGRSVPHDPSLCLDFWRRGLSGGRRHGHVRQWHCDRRRQAGWQGRDHFRQRSLDRAAREGLRSLLDDSDGDRHDPAADGREQGRHIGDDSSGERGFDSRHHRVGRPLKPADDGGLRRSCYSRCKCTAHQLPGLRCPRPLGRVSLHLGCRSRR